MEGYIKCVDSDYQIVYAKRDDPRLINGVITKITKKLVTAKDVNNNNYTVFDNDPRLKSGELYPAAAKHFTVCKIHGRQKIEDYKMKSRVIIPEEYKCYCPVCEEFYLSEEYVPSQQDIDDCILALNNIHFVSSNQQTEKYFKKYLPQFYKIINNFKLETSLDLLFSEKIYFLKNKIYEVPKCLLSSCNEKTYLVKRPGFGFTLYCKKHIHSNYSSKQENDIYEFIRSIYQGPIEKNHRKFGKEIDIYIPELKIGIEFNGLYWHSEKAGWNKNDHYEKYVFLKNKGIELITIWEDYWKFKPLIIKSILSNKLNAVKVNVGARECTVALVSNLIKTNFLNENHVQGNCPSSINLGLYYKDELVSIMTFGKQRLILGVKNSKKDSYEMLRFCSKMGFNIQGAASKLFSFFIKNYNVQSIISYANLDFGEGALYDILGFKNLGHTGINYWWTDFSKRYHRSGFMKHKLIKEGFDKNKTEEEIMFERGYSRIWGIGNNKWLWENKEAQ